MIWATLTLLTQLFVLITSPSLPYAFELATRGKSSQSWSFEVTTSTVVVVGWCVLAVIAALAGSAYLPGVRKSWSALWRLLAVMCAVGYVVILVPSIVIALTVGPSPSESILAITAVSSLALCLVLGGVSIIPAFIKKE